VLRRYVVQAASDVRYLTGKSRDHLLDDYREMLGVDLAALKEEDLRDSDLLAALAAYAIRRTSPWAKYMGRGDPRQNMRFYAYIPEAGDRTKDELRREVLQRGSVQDVDVRVVDSPYSLVTKCCLKFPEWMPAAGEVQKGGSADNFGGIVSVDYWRSSNELAEMLQSAEECGDLYRNLAVGGYTKVELARRGGIGYLDPRFVDPAHPWTHFRWKPWAPNAAAVGNSLQRVLVYATLLGNHAAATSAQDREVLGSIRERFLAAGWELPILVKAADRRGLEGADPDWRWARSLYVEYPNDPRGYRDAGMAEVGWKKDELHRNLNELHKKLKGLSQATIKLFEWEMKKFTKLADVVDLTNDERHKIRANACGIHAELDAEVRANFANKNPETLETLLGFYDPRKLLAALDAVFPLRR
jgi:hypothetical protein